ncbi:hypothetical protein FACS1894125_0900 [Actinomycetota bacterium]|nr:hypothetical protein FACS1894125_0900 [Actinomycetota bacterium]
MRTDVIGKTIQSFIKKHIPVLIIVLVVLIANIGPLLFSNSSPELLRSGINGPVIIAYTQYGGGASIDPNDGFTKQSLGVQATNQVVHGEFPLWNHFEGVGVPLLGETQSAAIFPFTLLLKIPGGLGWILFHIVLEIIAGIGMYLFLRRQKIGGNEISNAIATTGGCLFSTIGTFTILNNACFNPIPFLPWQMLGVYIIFSTSRKNLEKTDYKGYLMLTISLILSLLSGFPEIAYINGIFVLVYAIILAIKVNKSFRLKSILLTICSGVTALFVCAPWIIEFITFLNPSNGSIGAHESEGLAFKGLDNNPFTYLLHFLPNTAGHNLAVVDLLGNMGSYFQLSVLVLALFAIFSKQVPLWIKFLFGGTLLLSWLRVIAVPGITFLFSKIPFAGSAALFRYLPPLMSFCFIFLACLGLSQLERISKRLIGVILFLLTVFYLWVILGSITQINDMVSNEYSSHFDKILPFLFISISVFSVVVVLSVILLKIKNIHKVNVISVIIVLESILLFCPWGFLPPIKGTQVDTSAISFLQQNLGNQRFDSTVLQPNYGSKYGIAQVRFNDLPSSQKYCDYLGKVVKLTDGCISWNNWDGINSDIIDMDKKLGAKYIWVMRDELTTDIITDENLSLVWENDKWQIFENGGYREYISGTNCDIVSDEGRHRFDKFYADCSSDSTLTRLELNYPGWHAYVDDIEVEINETDNLFQAIKISAGEHSIEFKYWSKYMTLAIFGMCFGFFLIALSVAALLRDSYFTLFYNRQSPRVE